MDPYIDFMLYLINGKALQSLLVIWPRGHELPVRVGRQQVSNNQHRFEHFFVRFVLYFSIFILKSIYK